MFYVEDNGKIVLFNEDRQVLENTLNIMPQYADLEIKVTDRPIIDFEFADTPEWEEEQAQKEAERISHLKCTKRVFVLMLEQMGLDYFEQILPLIKANRQAELEWELCVELERANPLLDLMGAQLGVSPTQIDNLFKYANGEITQEQFLGGK